jgi:cytochrome d ubiquinol oxidase subunit I
MLTLQKEYEAKFGPGDYIPPVKTTFWSFRIMVGAGMLMIFASMIGLYLSFRKKLESNKWYLRFMVWMIAFPFIANSAGWIMTEIGRQPWTVFGMMTTAQSISPNVSYGMLLFSVISFTTIYLILAIVLAYLFIREIKKGAHSEENTDQKDETDLSTDPFDGGAYHGIS